MNNSCTHKGCHAPAMSCACGEELEDCPYWQKPPETADWSESARDDDAAGKRLRFPWTGNAMGPADLPYLAGASKVKLLTLAGPSDAGKTSLLASFYLLIARGIRPAGVEFTGSVTLEGWENIAGSLRWSATSGPTFPLHTSSGSGRCPGMLHLSLDTPQARCELVAADAPGEWFNIWASNQTNPHADGARWLSERTDVFLVIADSQALAGAGRGEARVALVNLLRRVGAEAIGRPVALVWTKCDVEVPLEMKARIREAAQRSLKAFDEFQVSMFPLKGDEARNRGQGIVELLQWILAAKPATIAPTADDDAGRRLLRTFGAFI